MNIVDIREWTVPIYRFADPDLPSGGLTTSVVALVTDVVRDGRPVVGYGFSSFGRFGQGGLINERFAPRLLRARAADLLDPDGAGLDPFRAWAAMMAGEKPGGHGERCVAVGTLDMAVWDAAAKMAGLPLWRFLSDRVGLPVADPPTVAVYAGGGYLYPDDDIANLKDELRRLLDQGYTCVKIKIGSQPLAQDLKRIEAARGVLAGRAALAVDAMNAYDRAAGLEAAAALVPSDIWWFEDVCDPLDFDTLAAVAGAYPPPIAAGEALFSLAEAKLLHRHGGLRRDRDVLVFDPVHCYGLSHYLKIIEALEAEGWPRRAFWPHGGHLFSLQVVGGLGLGGSEVNPFCFQPFGGLADGQFALGGTAVMPERAGIGFESRAALMDLFRAHLGT